VTRELLGAMNDLRLTAIPIDDNVIIIGGSGYVERYGVSGHV
jgi:hypothetical protein